MSKASRAPRFFSKAKKHLSQHSQKLKLDFQNGKTKHVSRNTQMQQWKTVYRVPVYRADELKEGKETQSIENEFALDKIFWLNTYL